MPLPTLLWSETEDEGSEEAGTIVSNVVVSETVFSDRARPLRSTWRKRGRAHAAKRVFRRRERPSESAGGSPCSRVLECISRAGRELSWSRVVDSMGPANGGRGGAGRRPGGVLLGGAFLRLPSPAELHQLRAVDALASVFRSIAPWKSSTSGLGLSFLIHSHELPDTASGKSVWSSWSVTRRRACAST